MIILIYTLRYTLFVHFFCSVHLNNLSIFSILFVFEMISKFSYSKTNWHLLVDKKTLKVIHEEKLSVDSISEK